MLQCFDTVGLVIWPVKIVPKNDLLCVEWDVKPYTHTHKSQAVVAPCQMHPQCKFDDRRSVACRDNADISIFYDSLKTQ